MELKNWKPNRTESHQIEKMTRIELMNFVMNLDYLKYEKMNWFKGMTTIGLRNQVRNWYNKNYK